MWGERPAQQEEGVEVDGEDAAPLLEVDPLDRAHRVYAGVVDEMSAPPKRGDLLARAATSAGR